MCTCTRYACVLNETRAHISPCFLVEQNVSLISPGATPSSQPLGSAAWQLCHTPGLSPSVSCCPFQAVDSIHQVGVYCLALVPANTLPKAPLGGIHISETKQRFLEGTLHPCNVLMCPHTCVTNLPKPRQKQPGWSYVAIAVCSVSMLVAATLVVKWYSPRGACTCGAGVKSQACIRAVTASCLPGTTPQMRKLYRVTRVGFSPACGDPSQGLNASVASEARKATGWLPGSRGEARERTWSSGIERHAAVLGAMPLPVAPCSATAWSC